VAPLVWEGITLFHFSDAAAPAALTASESGPCTAGRAAPAASGKARVGFFKGRLCSREPKFPQQLSLALYQDFTIVYCLYFCFHREVQINIWSLIS
jgi:hypothetical protein